MHACERKATGIRTERAPVPWLMVTSGEHTGALSCALASFLSLSLSLLCSGPFVSAGGRDTGQRHETAEKGRKGGGKRAQRQGGEHEGTKWPTSLSACTLCPSAAPPLCHCSFLSLYVLFSTRLFRTRAGIPPRSSSCTQQRIQTARQLLLIL